MSDAQDWGRRLQAAREKWVDVQGKRYKIRRPLDRDMRALFKAGADVGESLATDYVLDWEGVTEADLLPGVGGEDPVPFSRGAYLEWVGDRLDVLAEISNAIWTEYQARRAIKESVEGKSPST